jgi:hypothetical protein
MKVAAEKDGYGHRDEKGYWVPPGGAAISPFFQKPLKPLKILSFLLKWGGYLLPWNLLFAGLAFFDLFLLNSSDCPGQPPVS